MKVKLLFLLLLLALITAGLYYGLPLLKDLRDNGFGSGPEKKDTFSDENLSVLGARPVQVDITIESICQNMITGDVYDKCLEPEGCEKMCEQEGCELFGLEYVKSKLVNESCLCYCLEENKIKKALAPQRS